MNQKDFLIIIIIINILIYAKDIILKIKIKVKVKQKEIAQILSSLDDKIELNNAINRNLEEQAQAIFKSWFIDFEPFGGEPGVQFLCVSGEYVE